MLKSTRIRVPANTSDAVNERIRKQTEQNVAYFADHPEEIGERLHELGREWDIERAIEANASTLALTSVVLGLSYDKRFLLLSALVTGFLFQHAIQGWCPPVPALRRLGFRTASEIDEERYALKCLRGDFASPADAPLTPRERVTSVLRAVRL